MFNGFKVICVRIKNGQLKQTKLFISFFLCLKRYFGTRLKYFEIKKYYEKIIINLMVFNLLFLII